MTVTRFEAFALPAQNAPGTDHTYVVIANTIHFGCHGRSTGGTLLLSAPGHLEFGECLATPTGSAGDVYGFTGVCHQAVNRILLAAGGATVSRARGARFSIRAWGTYGRLGWRRYSPVTFPWPELSNCQARWIGSAQE